MFISLSGSIQSEPSSSLVFADAAMAVSALRVALFAQVRSRPWRLPRSDAVQEVRMQARVPEFPEMRDVTLDGRRAEGVEEIRCPVLVLWGTRDLLLAPRQAAASGWPPNSR